MKKNLTEIIFILDRSGSMSGLEADTIGGFNSMIEKQKKADGEAMISTVLFDNVSEVIHDRVSVLDILLCWMQSAGRSIISGTSTSMHEPRMSRSIPCSSSQQMAWRMQAATITPSASSR